MTLTYHIAKQLRDIHFGGNWVGIDLKKVLQDVDWVLALTQVQDFNTIAKLVYHTHYYIAGVSEVLKGEPLAIRDKFSFDLPTIANEDDWQQLQNKVWEAAETFAILIENMPEEKLWEDFTNPQYGTYYKNLHGIIEHIYYHLGQIVFIKKMVGNHTP